MERRLAASPYATGGGGTVLEHKLGAVFLTHLLVGDPIPELGDNFVPLSVGFQASAFSPVDDLMLIGHAAAGNERRVSIGVRRNPSLASSDKTSIGLLTTYLDVVTQ